MTRRDRWARAAALAVMAAAGVARAEQAVPRARALVPVTGAALREPIYLQGGGGEAADAAGAAKPAPRKPLMGLLDAAGIAAPLEQARISLYGHVEGSYTYVFDDPAGGVIVGRVFDFEHDDFTLNQLDLTAERTVDPRAGKFDVGGRVEFVWGADSRLMHSVGLFDWQGPGEGSNNQWDLTQAYVDVAVPVGNGLRIRAGKFVALHGYETINPSGNFFYSHSYLFGFAVPFTHTGVLGTYQVNKKLTVMGGFTLGWDTSLEDNNDTIDFLGQASYAIDDQSSFIVNLVTGPDQPEDNQNWRTVVDLIYTRTISDNLTIALNADYGYEANSTSSVSGSDAQWYGIAAYASYKLSDALSLNGRAEYFNDDDGARIAGAGGDEFWEATVGVAIRPFAGDAWGENLVIRPEVRYDYSEEGSFDGNTDYDQFTAAIDAYFLF